MLANPECAIQKAKRARVNVHGVSILALCGFLGVGGGLGKGEVSATA